MFGRSKQISDPSALITTADAKTHLRVDGSDEDDYIDGLVAAATRHIENFCMRPIMQRNFRDSLPDFPRHLELYWGGVSSVSAVQYYDANNAQQTLSTDYYHVNNLDDDLRTVIGLNDGYDWPEVYDDRADGVQITYTAGWSAASAVPDDLVHAVKLVLGKLYEQREDIGGRRDAIPTFAQNLAMPYRMFER